MKGATRFAAAAVLAASALAGCGERPQLLDASGKKVDAPAWAADGAASSPFYASGWHGGDKAAWEAQIRSRNQAQNDYAR